MDLTIPKGNFEAYLFDCDGTIADTMSLHRQAWLKALAPWNCDFPLDLFYDWAGIATLTIVEMLNKKYHLNMPAEKIGKDKEAYYLAIASEVKVIPSVLWHIEAMSGKIPFAVVSGSPKASVLKTLKLLNLQHHFDAIVTEGDYLQGKPHPEPYLMAAKLLKVAPEKCLVFEDAELGIDSAKAAGMAWVRVPQAAEQVS